MLAIFRLLNESMSLLDNPCRICLPSTVCDDDLSALEMDENQDIQVDEAARRHGSFGKEITGP